MSDGKSLELLLELVQSPLLQHNFFLYKYQKNDMDEISRDDPRLADAIEHLGRAFESVLKHLVSQGIPVEHFLSPHKIATSLLN